MRDIFLLPGKTFFFRAPPETLKSPRDRNVFKQRLMPVAKTWTRQHRTGGMAR